MTRAEMIAELRVVAASAGIIPRESIEKVITALLAEKHALPCAACREDHHEECGGPEIGCGCAARGHE
jgi:hypothetical protein